MHEVPDKLVTFGIGSGIWRSKTGMRSSSFGYNKYFWWSAICDAQEFRKLAVCCRSEGGSCSRYLEMSSSCLVYLMKPYWCSWKGHQHVDSIQSFINLGKPFFPISRIWNISQTWFLARVFVYLSFFISQILVLLYWMNLFPLATRSNRRRETVSMHKKSL